MLKAALFAQAAAALMPAPDIRFDLRDLIAPDACAPTQGDEIVVCAKRQDDRRFRLPTLGIAAEEAGLPRAETTLFGSVKGSIEAETREIGGAPSNRIMLRLTTPF